MSLFGLILLILFAWFVLRPVIRFFVTVNHLQRQARQSAGHDPRNRKTSRERKAGWTAPASNRKKIGRDIGEYIEYEEVSTVSAPTAADNEGGDCGKYTSTESQIVDVEWEDIR